METEIRGSKVMRDEKRDRDRIRSGIRMLDLSWLDGTGVICYERARRRIAEERPADADSRPAV